MNELIWCILVYVVQVVSILAINYILLNKGASMYEFLAFRGWAKLDFPVPVWVLLLPLVGTFTCAVVIAIMVTGFPIMCIIALAYRAKPFLKKHLKFRIK